MRGMASKNQEVWLWVGLVVGYCAAVTINKQLLATRKASEIKHHAKPPSEMLSQETEDAIKLQSLGQLTQDANQDIRAAAIRIILDRVAQGGSTWDLILHDISRSNTKRRDKALRCFRFVISVEQTMPHNRRHNPKILNQYTFKALIDCLCNLIPEACTAEATKSYHSQAERDSISILVYILTEYDTGEVRVTEALQAGLVSRWLANFPFGGPDASTARKKEIIWHIVKVDPLNDDSDFDFAMGRLLYMAFRIPDVRKEMEKHGLIDAPDIDDADFCPVRARANDRPREESFEEQALRRRRREAIVLGENGRPIQREDIIERGPDPMEEPLEESDESEVEAELERLTEEVAIEERNRWSLLRRLRTASLASLW